MNLSSFRNTLIIFSAIVLSAGCANKVLHKPLSKQVYKATIIKKVKKLVNEN